MTSLGGKRGHCAVWLIDRKLVLTDRASCILTSHSQSLTGVAWLGGHGGSGKEWLFGGYRHGHSIQCHKINVAAGMGVPVVGCLLILAGTHGQHL